jgi:hypothetical protein
VSSRDESQSLADCLDCVATAIVEKFLCCILEHRQHVVLHNIQLLQHLVPGLFHDFLLGRRLNRFKLDASLMLNLADPMLSLGCEKGHTDT